MKFVTVANLKTEMRLARPIYNRQGVLLFERNSKLTTQGIASLQNFGLIGLFILEPAEPVPPMMEEDIAFEQFQAINVFAIQDEMDRIYKTEKMYKMEVIVANIIRSYGRLNKKINFIQELRGMDDYLYKHSLNVAMLTAMISNKMQCKIEEQTDAVTSAVLHDIGLLHVEKEIYTQAELEPSQMNHIQLARITGYDLIEKIYGTKPSIRRACAQANNRMNEYAKGVEKSTAKLITAAKILIVADTFDSMTAMQHGKEPASEVKTIRYMLENEYLFEPQVVKALLESIQILAPGTSVELNTGEKALVLSQNEQDILSPMVLCFGDNNVIDLSNKRVYGDLEIVDIMKTMDNRYIMDTESLKKYGFEVEEQHYVEAPSCD